MDIYLALHVLEFIFVYLAVSKFGKIDYTVWQLKMKIVAQEQRLVHQEAILHQVAANLTMLTEILREMTKKAKQ